MSSAIRRPREDQPSRGAAAQPGMVPRKECRAAAEQQAPSARMACGRSRPAAAKGAWGHCEVVCARSAKSVAAPDQRLSNLRRARVARGCSGAPRCEAAQGAAHAPPGAARFANLPSLPHGSGHMAPTPAVANRESACLMPLAPTPLFSNLFRVAACGPASLQRCLRSADLSFRRGIVCLARRRALSG